MNTKLKGVNEVNCPVLAICYDFDQTLSPCDLQAQGFIQDVGYDIETFWEEANILAEDCHMDSNLAYMYKMVEKAEGNFSLTREKLMWYGSRVKLFEGVVDWFSRIREYGSDHGILVEHYIISSGIREMIEGTLPALNNEFKEIYASSFYFDENGVAKWPSQVINYTNKTQFLFRIEKGTLDINDDAVNNYFLQENLRIPFRNFVYIGDSYTDIPCMKLVNSYGGHSIGVYNPDESDKNRVYKLIRENRIKYFAAADYREGTEIDTLIKAIIDKTAAYEKLERISQKNMSEAKGKR